MNVMKSFDTDLKKYSEKINLKVSERHALRERVLSYMEYHPLPKQASLKNKFAQGIPSQSFITIHFASRYRRIASGVFIFLLILAPFVAERSAPGDVLYLVKTGFNETIQGQLVSTSYEKIEFETKLMERRIAEARVLASEGKLTEAVKTQIAVTVKEHTVAVQTGLAELRVEDAEAAAIAEIAFNSSLEVQSAVLGTNESTNSTSSIDSILTVVNEAHDAVASNQDNVTPSFDGLIAKIESETTRAFELFTTIKVSATSEEIIDIERRISDTNRLIVEAKELRITDEQTATNDLIVTLGLVQKLVVFMTDISVQESITLDELVPIILSDEERIEAVRNEIIAVGEMNRIVTQRLEASAEFDETGKVGEGIERVAVLLIEASTGVETLDIELAENTIREARALVNDLISLTGGEEKAGDVPPQETLNSSEDINIEEEKTGSTTLESASTTLSV